MCRNSKPFVRAPILVWYVQGTQLMNSCNKRITIRLHGQALHFRLGYLTIKMTELLSTKTSVNIYPQTYRWLGPAAKPAVFVTPLRLPPATSFRDSWVVLIKNITKGDEIKEDWDGRVAVNAWGWKSTYVQFWWERANKRYQLEELGVGGIILK